MCRKSVVNFIRDTRSICNMCISHMAFASHRMCCKSASTCPTTENIKFRYMRTNISRDLHLLVEYPARVDKHPGYSNIISLSLSPPPFSGLRGILIPVHRRLPGTVDKKETGEEAVCTTRNNGRLFYTGRVRGNTCIVY